jgi:IMP dehydrogenase
MNDTLLTFDDVLIVPKFSDIESRKDVDISFNGSGFPYMRLPVISANMDTISGPAMSHAMLSYGAQSCLHRFQTVEQNIQMFIDSHCGATGESYEPMVSIGLGTKELERAEALFKAGAYVFVVDVAHGAQMSVVNQAIKLREIIKDNGSIIVGNFATGKSVMDFLKHFDVIDGVKVGIGPGSSCTTRVKTGVGYPQLSAIQSVSAVLKFHNYPIGLIADGGMKTPGDIAKALGAGADAVMFGGMLSGTRESPPVQKHIETLMKENEHLIPEYFMNRDFWGCKFDYRGSASKESYAVQGKDASWRTAEGESFMVSYKGPVKNILQGIEGGLRSAFSYVGARNLQEFQEKVEFVRVSNAGYAEGLAHGKK